MFFKRGIENLGHQFFKYKKMKFEYFIEGDALCFITNSLNFEIILDFLKNNHINYLGDRTIKCKIRTIIDVNPRYTVRKLKKIMTKYIKDFIDRNVLKKYPNFMIIKKYK